MKELNTTEILEIPVTTSSDTDVLEFVLKRLEDGGEKTFIATPNPEMVMIAKGNKVYQNILRSADVLLPDGVGLLWAARVLGKSLKKRITGVDFMQMLCREAAKRQLTVGFFGGVGNVAEKTSQCLKKSYPDLTIGYIGDKWDEEGFRVKGDIDILFVALGAPKQEEWIDKNLPEIKVRCAMGVGGAFDYISGNVNRAPSWMRSMGLEWLYRLIRQPWRWRRQLALIRFVLLVVLVRLRIISE